MTQVQKQKLTSVTRRDIPVGYQAVQSSHSIADFILQHPQIAKSWHKSNYLVSLTVKNEEELIKLIQKAELKGITYTLFREPDIGNQITSVTFEPSEQTRKLVSSLPLLGKEAKND